LRFLIDECLTPALTEGIHRAGHEAYHIAHLGLASSTDPRVVFHALTDDLIFVTNNAVHFRSLYSRRDLHPGLLIIIPSVERETQIRLFRALLNKVVEIGEPVNLVIEADLDGDGIRLELYEWPTAPK
jgi:predicted nuclease of predicted toxin-antitoxin system